MAPETTSIREHSGWDKMTNIPRPCRGGNADYDLSMVPATRTLRVLLLKSNDVWVAQCLEHDIAAQGRSIEAAKASFEHVFLGHVKLDESAGREPLANVPPAPDFYWERFRKASRLADPLTNVPPAFMVGEALQELRVAS